MADISSLMDKLQASKQLINMDRNGQIDRIKENAERNGSLSYDKGLKGEDAFVSNNIQPKKDINQINPQVAANSKLPKEIVESFKNKPMFSNAANPYSNEGSVLDQLNSMTNGKLFENMQKESPKPLIKETTMQAQPTTNKSNTNVDYSMIRMIVEDTMKKYAGALKRTIINESKTTMQEASSSLQAMKIGNKFSFIDNKGNLYEAELKFIKNINKKK